MPKSKISIEKLGLELLQETLFKVVAPAICQNNECFQSFAARICLV